MTRHLSGAGASLLWSAVFTLLALSPVLLIATAATAAGGFYWDFAVASGFSAIGLLLLMFVLSARFRHLAAPFGIDLVYYFHRQLAMGLVCLVLLHALVLLLTEPATRAYISVSAPAYMLAGGLAFLCLALLLLLSLLRRRLGFCYELWRRTHLLLAVLAVTSGAAHVAGAHHYMEQPSIRGVALAALIVWVLLVLRTRLFRPWLLARRPWRVASVTREQGSVVTLMLEPLQHGGLRFEAGQFAWLSAGRSPFAMAEHPFSIASSAERSGSISFTVKALGDFTSQMQSMQPGTKVYVDGPYGMFCMDRVQAEGLFFVAGGIGIVPVMSMLRTLADRNDRRPLTLLYAASDLEGMTFYNELQGLSVSLNLVLVPVPCQVTTDWRGACGRINPQLIRANLPADARHWHFFLCGPPAMMQMTESALHRAGVQYRQVHSELFNLV